MLEKPKIEVIPVPIMSALPINDNSLNFPNFKYSHDTFSYLVYQTLVN